MEQPCTYTFDNQLTADVIQVHNWGELPDALHRIGLQQILPTLVLVGGASKIAESDLKKLQNLFVEIIAPIAENLGIAVVDGGTDAGIMRFIGQARTHINASFPLVGVAAIGTVIRPGIPCTNADAAMLEPNHTHFVLVPGSNWGDESPWLAQIGSHLSQELPSVTIVVNGGEITWQDVGESIKAGRPTIVLSGSGRTADQLAAAMRGEEADQRAIELVASGLLHSIDMRKEAEELASMIEQILSSSKLNSAIHQA
ncbi:MAG TPA: hypothetical protein DCL61_14850 [Cyanobacteria bacterium UBA12227]|nr:hypothetical protein [Cyanobacteria bacterium UBA12227]HAX87774.1 hypothetical protein [Cyanobacteria bacterium UBA11370]HBY79224.1 hypothetical protein [Cyanobacteria bacterium UBA11148]